MKSNVSDCLEVMAGIYQDATIKCTADVSDHRDLLTLRSRTEAEGLSFLTITLPAFCKDFERSLADGIVDSTAFAGFRRAKGGAIPAFLQGMLSRIFGIETGRLLYENPQEQTTIIEGIRQICLAFKKVEMPCTPKREAKALASFAQIERELQTFSLHEDTRRFFRLVSTCLWGDMLRDFSHQSIYPRHGPGATAEKISGNQKYNWRYWVERLEPFFPLVGTGYSIGISVAREEIEKVNVLTTEQELPVRVVFVPKTLKSPRVIAIEPAAMQYAQQGVRDYLYRKLSHYRFTAGQVNFTDQSINQTLALAASEKGHLATIDLSDASDRVPLDLVIDMLSCNQDFLDCVLACRSTSANLPNGELISPLRKFASMGSALCFPIEAMYFYTICVIALLKARNLPVSTASLAEVCSEIYVYGDDIIVPSTNAVEVLDSLQEYNCKPNSAKTFWTGKFRESCGTDAYDGYEVTPTYIRHLLPCDRRQASAIASWVAASNAFYKRGYWRTAQLIRSRIDSILGPLPYLAEDAEGLGYFSFLGYRSVGRWHENAKQADGSINTYQRFEVRTFVVKPVHRTDELNGYPALTKSLLKLETSVASQDGSKYDKQMDSLGLGILKLPVQESSPFDVTVQRGAVALKLRWVRT